MASCAQKPVYPALIFKEAWGICRKNLAKLSAIYLIFYVPYLLLSGAAVAFPGDQSNILSLISALLGLWSGVALLTASKKASDAEDFSIGESILLGARKYLVSYVAVALLIFVFLAGLLFSGASAAIVAYALVGGASVVSAAVAQLTPIVIVVCLLVYFMIRWALGGTVCVTENAGPIAALKRSAFLIRDYVNPVVGEYALFILTAVVVSIPYMAWLAIFGRHNDGMEAEIFAGAINNIIINVILMPFLAVIMVILYKKLKEAKEANVRA